MPVVRPNATKLSVCLWPITCVRAPRRSSSTSSGPSPCYVRRPSPCRHFQSKLNRDVYPHYEVREIVNEHHSILFAETRSPPFRPRTLVCSLLWKKVCDEPLTYVWCAVSIDGHASVSAEDELQAVRADVVRCVKLTALSAHLTKLEVVTSLDPKGNFPYAHPPRMHARAPTHADAP